MVLFIQQVYLTVATEKGGELFDALFVFKVVS